MTLLRHCHYASSKKVQKTTTQFTDLIYKCYLFFLQKSLIAEVSRTLGWDFCLVLLRRPVHSGWTADVTDRTLWLPCDSVQEAVSHLRGSASLGRCGRAAAAAGCAPPATQHWTVPTGESRLWLCVISEHCRRKTNEMQTTPSSLWSIYPSQLKQQL